MYYIFLILSSKNTIVVLCVFRRRPDSGLKVSGCCNILVCGLNTTSHSGGLIAIDTTLSWCVRIPLPQQFHLYFCLHNVLLPPLLTTPHCNGFSFVCLFAVFWLFGSQHELLLQSVEEKIMLDIKSLRQSQMRMWLYLRLPTVAGLNLILNHKRKASI